MTTTNTACILDSKVIGLQGQRLGNANELIIDTDDGAVTHVVLSTAWQNITIPWNALYFDASKQTLTMRAQSRLRR